MRWTLILLLLIGCDDGGESPADAGRTNDADARPADAALPDAADPDADRDGPDPDGSRPDANPLDARPQDADPGSDAGEPDATIPDAALPDVPNLGECASPADCLDFRACVGGACVDNEASPFAADLVLNEVLIDGALDQDANGDGDIDPVDDEFVELVNVSDAPLDLAGWLIVERDLQGIPRHVFPADTTLDPGAALVVFGGGAPSEELEATPNATFTVVNAADPAFNNGLNLDDDGDTLRLLDAEGHEVAVFSYGEGCARPPCAPIPADRSLSRVPDLMGDFAPHPDEVMSPGTRTDGEPFP